MPKEKRVIENVYRLEDDMVNVFDQFGEPMKKYEGKYEKVIDKINKDKPEGVEVLVGAW